MERLTVSKKLCAEECNVGDEIEFFDRPAVIIEVTDDHYICYFGTKAEVERILAMTTTDGIVYSAIVKECEELERDKKYVGNGHHLAQKLSKMVKEELEKRELVLITKEHLEIYREMANNPIFED